MKKVLITNLTAVILLLPVFLKAQIVVDESFKVYDTHTEILQEKIFFETGNHSVPIVLNKRISGFSLSGNISFTGEMGFVRMVLRDEFEYDFLVLETNTIFENNTSISFDAFCEETALLNHVLPKQLIVECTDAEITISEIQYSTDSENLINKDREIKQKQLNAKLQHINAVLAQKEITWGAGLTSLSEMTYMGKKNLFGGTLPNLAGFDYYVSGIYVMQGFKQDSTLAKGATCSQFVPEFDWRNRHGRNWITPVKNQLSCGSCWVFSAVGTTEAHVNLYYNQLLNLDLSEQDIVSCYAKHCNAGSPGGALYYIQNTGVVEESCLVYAGSVLPCSDKCTNPNEIIKIEGYSSHSSSLSDNDFKKLVIKSPTSFGISSWNHAAGLVGYKTVQAGDIIYTQSPYVSVTITPGHPLIGSTAWLLKNSWGTSWGSGGFGYVVTDGNISAFSISGRITSLNYTDDDIICEDRDGDGYFFWGIGPKPMNCPCEAPSIQDGDDSNPDLGHMDEFGNFITITPPDTIAISQTWSTNIMLSNSIVIPASVILTITGQISCTEEVSIIIGPGGKLVLDGGILTAASSDEMWKGVVVLGNKTLPQLEQHQGTMVLKNSAVIEHALCAVDAASTFTVCDGFLSGGIIHADSAVFRNNLQAVKYYPYENSSDDDINVPVNNVGKFTHCTFTIDNNNRFSNNSILFQQHVSMWGVRGVPFEGCTFDNTATMLVKGTGIYTMDASYKVKNRCTPDPFWQDPDCPCPSFHTNTPTIFQNLDIGIHSENTRTWYSNLIDQSIFYDVNTGVIMNNQNNYRLTRSDFNNISGNGVLCNNSSGYQIEENTFSNLTGRTGITITNSGTADNRIFKNSFSNFQYGISVWGINGTLSNKVKTPRGLQFICNDFYNNEYDLNIVEEATIHPCQGNASSGANSVFLKTQISSIYSLGTQLITYYHSPGNNHTPYNPTSNITVIGNATANPCASTFCLPGGKSKTYSLEQYKAMQQQYDHLVAQLEDNPELLQEILVLSDAMRELSDHAISRILRDSIFYVNDLKQWYEVVRTPIAKYCLAEGYFNETNYDQAEKILQEIPKLFNFNETELLEHENYMQFYNFKKQLQLSGRKWNQLNKEEIVYLQTMSETTKGSSASMAQGVLCFFYNICEDLLFEYGEDGDRSQSIINKMESKTSHIQNKRVEYDVALYPNPTTGDLTINNEQLTINNVEIFDVYGRRLLTFDFQLSTDKTNISHLPSGIYFAKTTTVKGEVVVRKVVKQ